MMDWTDIITALIAALVPTGGLTAIVTMRDKKTAAFIENTKEINAHWKGIADDREQRAGNFRKSTLLKKVRVNPDSPSIRDEFGRWIYGGGRVLPGLVARREAEADLYFSDL